MKLLYFATVRERLGRAEETVDVPAGLQTVQDLLDWLRARDESYAVALSEDARIRAAVDQVHAKPETTIVDAREVAFFPPVTGG
ncbi:MAG: molybdopterin converting factor subunit 1 [Pseudomonadota bacterium]